MRCEAACKPNRRTNSTTNKVGGVDWQSARETDDSGVASCGPAIRAMRAMPHAVHAVGSCAMRFMRFIHAHEVEETESERERAIELYLTWWLAVRVAAAVSYETEPHTKERW